MKKVVLDTNILINYEKGHAAWLETLRKREELNFIIPTIVISEYFASSLFESENVTKEADDLLGLFAKQDFNESIAKELALLLRHKTYPQGASLADLIIASTALCLDAELATRNIADFATIPNLRFFDPLVVK